MPVEITVRGRAARSHPPEHVTVFATVGYEGASMQPVYDHVAHDLAAITASLDTLLTDNGPVTSWSADQLSTWTHRPWDRGTRLPPVHSASVNVTVTFRQFDLMSRWVADRVGEIEGFRVERFNWGLTDERYDDAVRRVRVEAVRDAVTRAQSYADALELGSVTTIAIADAGMLGASLNPVTTGGFGPQPRTGAPSAAAVPAGPSVDLTTKDIEISASVDARFQVGV